MNNKNAKYDSSHQEEFYKAIQKHNINVPMFGMVKDSKHRTRAMVGKDGEIAIAMHKGIFKFVTEIQDEVHRFSIEYQRRNRKSKSYAVTLTKVPGIGEKKAEKEFEVTINVVSDANVQPVAEEAEEEIVCAVDSRKNGMVVVLSANVMGTGDEKLGTNLMKAFVFAVTKQDQLPETIVCYNTGAYLTCEGADTLEDLKILEAKVEC